MKTIYLPGSPIHLVRDWMGSVRGVKRTRVWDRVKGKERIYVDLEKYNGGRGWNGGVGHRVVVHYDGRVEFDPSHQWAGAAELGTLDRIKELAQRLVGEEYDISIGGLEE